MKYVLLTLLILSNSFCLATAQINSESVKTESVYLHTDKNIYIAGENLFYALYLKGSPGRISKYVYMVLRDRYNRPVTQSRVEINNLTAFGNVYIPDTLRSDIYQLICYTNSMRNEGENSYFTREIVVANRFDKKLELFDSTLYTGQEVPSPDQYFSHKTGNENLIIQIDKQVFSPGEKVTFSIETKNITKDSLTRLSVSVNEILPGIPDEPSIVDYFSDNNKATEPENLIQYHSNYQSEINGASIQGRILAVRKSDNRSAIDNRVSEADNKPYTLLISTPDSIANMQFATTDSSGAFRILLNPYYEGKELIIRLKENANAIIELDDNFKLLQPFVPSDLLNVRGIKSYLIRSINIYDVKRYYNIKTEIDSVKASRQSAAIPRVYYRPNSRVFPADYLQLPDFVEISRELLSSMKVRKSDDNYIMSFTDPQIKGFRNVEPVVFLDGVPVNDINQIINLGSGQIRCIDMLPAIRYFGEMSFAGILAVYSKNMEINNIQFTTPSIRYQALSSQNNTKPDLYKPTSVNKHIPDVRQMLLWKPDLILHNKEKQQIECYASDLRANYRITIQGITSSGLPISGSAIFTVKSKSK
ncbi:MAG TPA: hypothetical protein VIK07_10885 [Bacteroidales bacterium]